MKKGLFIPIIFIVLVSIFIIIFLFRIQNKPTNFAYLVKLSLGKDLGQPLGSLFTMKNKNGQKVFSAGFIDSHSTFIRDNGRVLNLFIKDTSNNQSIEILDKPFSKILHTRLFNNGKELIAFPHTSGTKTNESAKKLQIEENSWMDYKVYGKSYFGSQLVDNKELIFLSDRILFNGNTIYGPIDEYLLAYYNNATMTIFVPGEEGIILSCPWDAYSSDLTIKEDACRKYKVPNKDSFPYAFGNINNETLIALNDGYLYSLKNDELRTIYANTKQESMQFYSMLKFGDKLYLGHYPSGSLYVYDGNTLTKFNHPLIASQNTPKENREVQTLTIYNGSLYAGLWPWGTIWKYNDEVNAWDRVARLFKYPEKNSQVQAPYQTELNAFSKTIVFNDLGQRVVSLVPYNNSLFASTMNKSGISYSEFNSILSQQQLNEYGAVTKITNGNNMTCSFVWKENTTLKFIARNNRLRVMQDNKESCYVDINRNSSFIIDDIEIGKGVYGEFGGLHVELKKLN